MHVESAGVNAFFVRDDHLARAFRDFAPPLPEAWLHSTAVMPEYYEPPEGERGRPPDTPVAAAEALSHGRGNLPWVDVTGGQKGDG